MHNFAQLKTDERMPSSHLINGISMLWLSTLCFLFAMLTRDKLGSFALIAALSGFYGAGLGLTLLDRSFRLRMKRFSAGYRIECFKVNQLADRSLDKTPLRPHVYSPAGELIGILYSQKDVITLIESHMRKDAGSDYIKSLMVPEFYSKKKH